MPKLRPGEPSPLFRVSSTNNDNFSFDSAGGVYITLCFYGSYADPAGKALLDSILSRRDLFDDNKTCFFGISIDQDDRDKQRVRQELPGIRYFWDFRKVISKLFGVQVEEDFSISSFVLDPFMRIISVVEDPIPERHAEKLIDVISKLPPLDLYAGTEIRAPVLVAPRIFEPEFCRHLIDLYEQNGGVDSGYMREVNGMTVPVINHQFKKRSDWTIEDKELTGIIRDKISGRLVPAIKKAFQYKITRIERYIVACYDGDAGGFFSAHRDNTTRATAHRKFAVTINLNAEEYEGGDLMFPEFGTHKYRAPTGGAVVFSCSLLHKAMPVTRGRRYAFLPFLFDEEAELLRQENLKYLQVKSA